MFKWFYNLFFRESVDIKELRDECNSTIKKMHNRTQQMKVALDLIEFQIEDSNNNNNNKEKKCLILNIL